MADSRVTHQVAHVARAEDVLYESRSLVHVKDGTFARDDTRGVLPAMLQEQKAVVQHLVYRGVGNDANDSAHGGIRPFFSAANRDPFGHCGNSRDVQPTRAATTA